MAHLEGKTSHRLSQTLVEWKDFLKKYAPFFQQVTPWTLPRQIHHKNNTLPILFLLCLTSEECAALAHSTSNHPLGAYTRSKLFGGTEAPRKQRSRTRKPQKDEKALSELLGKLCESRLASNVNQLAKSANSGSLPVTPDTEKALQNACDDVRTMRMYL